MYYIYHIPNVKIGCSTNPKRRVEKQGYQSFEILETHDCIDSVSVREQELQKEYGYKVDNKSYKDTIPMASLGGKIGGKKNKESGHMSKVGKKYGTIQGKKNVVSGHMKRIQKLSCGLGGKQSHIVNKKMYEEMGHKINNKKFTCPHCNKTGQNRVMHRWHGDNCKYKD